MNVLMKRSNEVYRCKLEEVNRNECEDRSVLEST